MPDNSLNIQHDEDWSLVIKPKNNWLQLHLGDLWRYRDLLLLFVKRDFVAIYKQTILGPAWFFIQPILTTVIYIVVFGNIAAIPTDGLPRMVFYLSGITVWSYFAECINKTSNTFTANARIFGKVYFPRLIMPLSVICSNLIKFGIQFSLFIAILLYFLIFTDSKVYPNEYMLMLPVFVLMLAALGLGLGLIISSLTTKYRDLTHLVKFGVQLFMYATPIVYPLSELTTKNISDNPMVANGIRTFIKLNPLTSIVEGFRYAFLGKGVLDFEYLGYSLIMIVIILIVGIIVFNKIEKSFMDTV